MEEDEPKLKGSLLNKLAPTETSEPAPSLRGTLLPKPAVAEDLDPTVLNIGTKLVQRDSGTEFTVSRIIETKNGQRINLSSSDGKSKITLSKEDLENKLDSEGGPWNRK